MKHLTMDELEETLDEIRESPKDGGVLELIVRRPRIDEREVLEEGELHISLLVDQRRQFSWTGPGAALQSAAAEAPSSKTPFSRWRS